MSEALRKTILAVFAPLVRYLVGQGWTYPIVSALLKEAYVAAAVQREKDGEPITDTRISLLTGVHRKEVKRLREAIDKGVGSAAPQNEAGIAVRIVAEWVTNRDYLNSRRKPRVLPFRATGDGPSFESLTRKVKADMRPGVVLDELLRTGVVKLVRDKVSLLRDAYVPSDPDELLTILGVNVRDHLQSAFHNLADAEAPYLERAVYYGVVDAGELKALRPELNRRAERFLKEINSLVMPLNDSALWQPTANRRRMRLGVYYYEDETMASEKAKTGKFIDANDARED